MTLEEAAEYHDSFEAILAGTGTLVQATEVDAVVREIIAYMREIALVARKMLEQRQALDGLLVNLPSDQKDAILKVLDGGGKKPRISAESIAAAKAEQPE